MTTKPATPDLTELEAKAVEAAAQLAQAHEAIEAQREANRQAYVTAAQEKACQLFDEELELHRTARKRMAEAHERIAQAAAADPVWAAIIELLRIEYQRDGHSLATLAANTGGQREWTRSEGNSNLVPTSDPFAIFKRTVENLRPARLGSREAMELITAAGRATGFDRTGAPISDSE